MLTAVKLWLLFNMLVLSCILARAEDQPPKVRALLERLNVEVGNTLTCSENVYTLLDKVKDLQAKLDAAMKSPEPKKD